MPQLVLLRHGQSLWNAENLFTGWYDVDLTAEGEEEARAAGTLLAADPDLDLRVVHTSLLTRAIRTANLTLDTAGRPWLPVHRHWRLNERHYGALQGLNKKETTARHGEAQVKEWRRSYATPPPPVERGSEHDPAGDPRYRDVPAEALPLTECLADVVERVVPYWDDAIVPDLLAEGRRGGAVLVVAHGNSLRALRKHLDGISDDDIVDLEIPTGIPYRYVLDDDLSVVSHGFLGDPEAAAGRRRGRPPARPADPPRHIPLGARTPALPSHFRVGRLTTADATSGRPHRVGHSYCSAAGGGIRRVTALSRGGGLPPTGSDGPRGPMERGAYRASTPRSPVRTRMISSTAKDPHLAVADLPGTGHIDDGVGHLVDLGIVDDDLEPDLRHELDLVLRTPVDLGVAPLAPEPLGLRQGHPVDAEGLEGLLDFIKFERLEHRHDQFHSACLL